MTVARKKVTKKRASVPAKAKATNMTTIEDLQRQAMEEAESTIEAPTGTTIKLIAEHQIEIPGVGILDLPTRVVVALQCSRNIYYDKPYVPGNPESPACYAQGFGLNDFLVYDPESPRTPNKPNISCKECPKMQFGSEPIRGQGRACQRRKLLAIAPPDATDPSQLWIVNLGAQNARLHFNPYMSNLSGLKKAPQSVTTEIDVVNSADGNNNLYMTFGNPQSHTPTADETQQERLMFFLSQMRESAKSLLETTRPIVEVEATPAQKTRKRR